MVRVFADHELRSVPINALTCDAGSCRVKSASATALGGNDELKLPQTSIATTRKLIDTGNERLRHILTDATKLMTVLGLKLADHREQRERIATVQKALVERKRIAAELDLRVGGANFHLPFSVIRAVSQHRVMSHQRQPVGARAISAKK